MSSVFARNDNALRVRTPQPSLTDFALAVREAARSPQVSRAEGDRAFIGSIWEHMRGRKPIGDMSLTEFKATLIRAHRERLVRISRASFVRALDPEEVRRSEARYHDATFHFVALDTGACTESTDALRTSPASGHEKRYLSLHSRSAFHSSGSALW